MDVAISHSEIDEEDAAPISTPARCSGPLGGRVVRGRVAHGRGRGARGSTGQGARGAAFRAEEERIYAMRQNRLAETQRFLQRLTLEEHLWLNTQLLARQPGLVFDTIALFQNRDPPPARLPEVPAWCVCNHCEDMPSDQERVCCGQMPEYCRSTLQHFYEYILDEGNLRLHRQYREEVTALGGVREPGDDNREYRYAAYRRYTFWQYGALGPGSRRPVAACCVISVRNKYPDPYGNYTGYIPGI